MMKRRTGSKYNMKDIFKKIWWFCKRSIDVIHDQKYEAPGENRTHHPVVIILVC